LYIDSGAQDPAAELARIGSAKAILATVTNCEAMQASGACAAIAVGTAVCEGMVFGHVERRASQSRIPLFDVE